MVKTSLVGLIVFTTVGVLFMVQGQADSQEKKATQQTPPATAPAAQPVASQEKKGVIPHTPLLKTAVPDTKNQEVAVYHVEYAPGGINPRHYHPAAVTFHILEGTAVFQEEGKEPVRLHAGDSLLVPTGTIHWHWNPSSTDRLRFLEFIVAEKDKGRSIPKPLKE
ncbi:MAG: cupin domain-containing protein [Phycisphaeraceae bacterium]|nr:cupin domain-containing protein [Phycisphaeraceae bacterium]